MSSSNSSSNGGIAILLFFGMLGLFGIYAIGLSYRGMRFMANYKISQFVVIDCESELVQMTGDPPISYYSFRLHVDGIDYPIERTEDVEISFWDAIRFRDPVPAKDWCALVGTTIKVAHYDKLHVVVPLLDPDPPSLRGLFTQVLLMEASGIVWLAPIFAGSILLVIAFGGIVALGMAVSRLDFKVERKPDDSSPRYAVKNFNHVSGLIISLVLGSLLAIGLGVAIVKGMLYVESSSSFYSGVIVLLGALIAAFGPALILTIVHWMRTTDDEYAHAIRTIVTIVTLTRVGYTTWRFVIETDFESLNLETSGDLIREILLSVVS